MSNYIYNASDDDLLLWNQNFTSRMGDGLGDPEEEFLELVKLIIRCRPGSRVLDIGCGLGRFVDLIGQHVGRMTCLEPDEARYRHCYRHHNNGVSVEVLHTTSGDYRRRQPEARFDLVLLSMVLQHVSTATCLELLDDMAHLLGPNGIGVIATTQQDIERFTYQSDPTVRSVAEFNEYCSSSEDQRYGIPVRQFSKASLLAAVAQSNLDIIRWGQFCYLKPEKVDWYANWMGSSPSAIENLGISQYAVVRRADRD